MRTRITIVISGLLGAAIAAAVAGCAYSVSPTGKLAHRTIAVPMFVNQSLEYGLEEAATRAVERAFIDDNRLKVVGASQAETVLRGAIKKYQRGAYTFDEREHVQEYKVEIWLDLEYVEVSSGKSIWHQPDYYVWAAYSSAGTTTGSTAVTAAASDTLTTAADEDGAKQQALQKAARETVARTIEGW